MAPGVSTIGQGYIAPIEDVSSCGLHGDNHRGGTCTTCGGLLELEECLNHF